jgi:ribosomal protein S18 acetylase RimI-like enzyme
VPCSPPGQQLQPFNVITTGSPDLEHVGSKVSIRVLDADGNTRDLVGTLTTVTSVQRRDGTLAVFQPESIIQWRLVPYRPSRAGTGAPRSIRIRELQEAAAATSPAQTAEYYGGWLMRASNQSEDRNNSAIPTGSPPFGDPSGRLDAACAHVVDFYTSRSLTPAIQVALPVFEQLDNYLDSQGWTIQEQAQVLVADADDFLPATGVGEVIRLIEPTAAWYLVQADRAPEPASSQGEPRYVLVELDGVPAGAGSIEFHGGWGIITFVHVAPGSRRREVGSRVLRELAAIALDAGCVQLTLEVSETNTPALNLFLRAKFRLHHRYRRRVLRVKSKAVQ